MFRSSIIGALSALTILSLPDSGYAFFPRNNVIDNNELRYLTNNVFEIRSWIGGRSKCLDVSGVNFRVGTRIHSWDCYGGVAQQWIPVIYNSSAASRGWFSLMSISGLCLDVPQSMVGRNEIPLQLWNCNGSIAQRFNLLGTFESPGRYDQIGIGGSFNYGTCIDIYRADRRNGAPIQTYQCRDISSADNQLWTLQRLRTAPWASSSFSPFSQSSETIDSSELSTVINSEESIVDVNTEAVPEPSLIFGSLLAIPILRALRSRSGHIKTVKIASSKKA